MATDLLLGIDGGGSKTRALIADRDGTVLGAGTAGTSNYQAIGFPAATKALEAAIARAARAAGIRQTHDFCAACFGLAGVDRPEDHAIFGTWLDQSHIAERHMVVNDGELVLAAGTPEGWGLALICGTGAICFGRDQAGHKARAGGWGYLLGDEGSGYDIARQALRIATQTIDGRAEAHTILQATLSHWGVQTPEQLMARIYRADTSRADLASLAGQIVTLADAGDRDAMALLVDAANELARLIRAVVQRLDLDAPPIAFGGGLLGASRQLQQRVIDGAGVPLGAVSYVADPAHGALRLARRLVEPQAA